MNICISKVNQMRKKILLGSLMVSFLMLVTPTISAKTNINLLDPPIIKPLGAFQIIIHPPSEPIVHYETLELTGTHKLIPSAFDRMLPSLWASQYSVLEVTESPEWLVVNIPNQFIFTPPDGNTYNFSIFITINDDASMNTAATFTISITTGKFMRTMFPSWFPLCSEFNLDQEILIRTGEW